MILKNESVIVKYPVLAPSPQLFNRILVNRHTQCVWPVGDSVMKRVKALRRKIRKIRVRYLYK